MMLSTLMSMTRRPLTYLRPFPMISLEKLDIKHVPYMFFDDFDDLAVVLPLVVFVDVDGGIHDVKSGS